jgi:N-formylglutamate amidohydrolase
LSGRGGGIGREERFNGGYLVDAYGSHQGTGIDAIQLEFGRKLRAPDQLDRTASDTARAVAAFARRHLPSTVAR